MRSCSIFIDDPIALRVFDAELLNLINKLSQASIAVD